MKWRYEVPGSCCVPSVVVFQAWCYGSGPMYVPCRQHARQQQQGRPSAIRIVSAFRLLSFFQRLSTGKARHQRMTELLDSR